MRPHNLTLILPAEVAPVETTKLSSKGQVIIPKHIRESHRWDTGLELQVIEFKGGILLKPKAPFERINIDDIAGFLQYSGPKKTDENIQEAMRQAARKVWRDSD